MTTALVWRTPDRIPPFLDDAEAARVLDGAQARAKICLWPLFCRKPHGSGDAVSEDRWVLAPYHPAYVLRLKSLDAAAYERTWQAFLEDFRRVAAKAREEAPLEAEVVRAGRSESGERRRPPRRWTSSPRPSPPARRPSSGPTGER
jgi:hypothetical protein